jgi:hypothetical protein
VKREHRDLAFAQRIAQRVPHGASLPTVADRDGLIDFLQHGLDGWRVVPEQHTVIFDRLDDFSRPLKLFL